MTARTVRKPRIAKCPGCDKPLHDGQTLDHVIGEVGGWYETSPGNFRKSRQEGKIFWHATCLTDFRAFNERSRAKALLAQDIDMARAFAGRVDPEVFVKAMRDNGRTEEHITAVLAAVEGGN